MNRDQHAHARLAAHALVTRMAVEILYKTLAQTTPAFAQALPLVAQHWRDQANLMALKTLSPEYSDLLAAEYQDAFEKFLTDVGAIPKS